ncbi:hypothetical protein [Photobacterium kishitanii]|uniref:Uncharacterized protein n=1 Tax=Photobacterium kishitanii TaxID=318456 RepID=A0A2T3KLS6_9GAMM|nr:hypothetical protein [Photobacterium kishitanii]PSV00664.1 hypothetical protein C9J27_05865 [Photobacterium kishitanii]
MQTTHEDIVERYASGVASMIGEFSQTAVEAALKTTINMVFSKNLFVVDQLLSKDIPELTRLENLRFLSLISSFLIDKYTYCSGIDEIMSLARKTHVFEKDGFDINLSRLFSDVLIFPYSMITVDDLFDLTDAVAGKMPKSEVTRLEEFVRVLVTSCYDLGIICYEAADLIADFDQGTID